MIASITGTIQTRNEDSLVINVQGIGFEVFVPKSLPKEVETSETIVLFTHLVVREDLLALYGFTTQEEKQFFLLLLGVEGIGPKLALAILSNLSVDVIRKAVLSEQPEFFNRVPGVGKKTAQKILIQLQGRVGAGPGFEISTQISSADQQVLEALIGLGYSIIEAQSAIQALPKDTPDTVEDKLRITLQYFDHG